MPLYASENFLKTEDVEAVVILDRKHRLWGLCTAAIALLAALHYWFFTWWMLNGTSGGSWQGMWYGFAGSACMIYAGLLSGRKAVPKWRVGSSQTWLRGHLWMGLLSVPLILLHCGFRWGGLLEQILLVVFFAVICSGIYGLALQQFLPRMMSQAVPAQAIAPQIGMACQKLRDSLEQKLQKVCGPAFLDALQSSRERQNYSPELELARFYWDVARNYLSPDATAGHELANPTLATARFERLRESLPEQFWNTVEQLRRGCDERRQLLSQSGLHLWLHGWLLLHVPLSVILLVLGLLHAVLAVYY